MATGSKSARITPLLGEAFFISAMTAACPSFIFWVMAASNPLGGVYRLIIAQWIFGLCAPPLLGVYVQ
jgi:hypothetical protein